MTYQINFEAYSNNFSIPAAIVGDDFASVDADTLKVILLIFKNADKNYSPNLLSNLLNLPEPKVDEAIRYWVGKGLLREREIETIAPAAIAISKHAPVPPMPRSAPSGELSFLVECMENQLRRPVTSVEYKSVVHILEYIRLPADVVLMAIEYCVSIGKMNARYLEKVCAGWADNGITTHELAEQYLSYLKQSRQNEAAVQKLFGIESRALIESEREHIARWFGEFRYGLDMIGLAYEKTIASIGKLSFPYLNKILQTWKEKGYQTLEDVQANEGGRKPAGRAGSASYDIDELDRYWDNVPKMQ